MNIDCPCCKKALEIDWDDLGDYECECGGKFYIAMDENYDGDYWFFVDTDEPIECKDVRSER